MRDVQSTGVIHSNNDGVCDQEKLPTRHSGGFSAYLRMAYAATPRV